MSHESLNETYAQMVIRQLPATITRKVKFEYDRTQEELRVLPRAKNRVMFVYQATEDLLWDDLDPILDIIDPDDGRRIPIGLNFKYSFAQLLQRIVKEDMVLIRPLDTNSIGFGDRFRNFFARMWRPNRIPFFAKDLESVDYPYEVIVRYQHW